MVEAARRNVAALALAGVGVVAVAVLVVLALPREHERSLLRPDQTIAVKTSFVPGEHLFGDSPLAKVDVLVNRALVDPSTVRVAADFKPYKLNGRGTLVRRNLAGVTGLEYRFPLSCLTAVCVPRKQRKDFTFPAAQISYVQAARGPRVDTAPWPTLEVVSRIRKADLSGRKFADGLVVLPAVTYRLDPSLLAGLLLTLALALVLGPAAYGAYRLRARVPERAPAPVRRARPLTPLEQALALVARALAGQGVDEQRKALERLARELVASDRYDLARESRRLAWSRTGPSVSEARALTGRVEEEVLGRAASAEAGERAERSEAALAGGA
jgi:hypothetical protein